MHSRLRSTPVENIKYDSTGLHPATAVATATGSGSPAAAGGAISAATAATKRAGIVRTVTSHISGTRTGTAIVCAGAAAGLAGKCATAAAGWAGIAVVQMFMRQRILI